MADGQWVTWEEGSESLEDDLTDQKTPQGSCFDRSSHSHANQDHPPCITHYPDKIHAFSMEGVEFSPGEATGNASKFSRMKEKEQESFHTFEDRIFTSSFHEHLAE